MTDRHHRKHWLKRAVRTGLLIALILLLLWLLMDAIQLHAALDELRRTVNDNGQSIDHLQQSVNGLTVKINGVIQNQQSAPVASAPSVPPLLPTVGVLGAIGGLLMTTLKLLPAVLA